MPHLLHTPPPACHPHRVTRLAFQVWWGARTGHGDFIENTRKLYECPTRGVSGCRTHVARVAPEFVSTFSWCADTHMHHTPLFSSLFVAVFADYGKKQAACGAKTHVETAVGGCLGREFVCSGCVHTCPTFCTPLRLLVTLTGYPCSLLGFSGVPAPGTPIL